MDKQTLWQKLTDWDRSPVLNYFKIKYYSFLLLDDRTNLEATEKLSSMAEKTDISCLIPQLMHLLGDHNRDVRSNATTLLIKIGKSAVPILMNVLEKHDEKSNSISWILGEMGEPAVPALIKALKNENEYVRKDAAYALGKAALCSTVPSLLVCLNDEVELVRRKASWALYKIARGQIEKENYPRALGIIKDSTQGLLRFYRGKKDAKNMKERNQELFELRCLTKNIYDKMNSVDNDKKFPRKRQEIKKQPKARRAILAS